MVKIEVSHYRRKALKTIMWPCFQQKWLKDGEEEKLMAGFRKCPRQVGNSKPRKTEQAAELKDKNQGYHGESMRN